MMARGRRICIFEDYTTGDHVVFEALLSWIIHRLIDQTINRFPSSHFFFLSFPFLLLTFPSGFAFLSPNFWHFLFPCYLSFLFCFSYSLLFFALIFLDTFSHLKKRLCSSVGPLVGPSVDPSVRHTWVEIGKCRF